MGWIRRHTGIVALVIAILVFIGCWFASPYRACASIVKAVQDKNVDELNHYVDYPALRFNLKQQLNNKIKVQLEENEKNPLALLGAAFTAPLVDTLVDELVTPSGVSAVLDGERTFSDVKSLGKPPVGKKAGESEQSQATPEGSKKEENSMYKMDWKSSYGSNFDEFNVTLTRSDKPETSVTVSMVRDGFFTWKINNILLPFNF